MNPVAPVISEACIPHDDVLEGSLSENEFAAKLSEVVFKPEVAPYIYSDPDGFFEKTYPTDGLQTLLTLLAKRYLGQHMGELSGEDGLLSLDTVFGGGKTHSQIAAYHFSSSPESIGDLGKYISDPETRREFEAVRDELSVRTAVFEGGYVSATNAKCNKEDENAPETQTMWGELAYQLAGAEGYAQFSQYDDQRIAPGESDVADLFEKLDNPGLVLIDEVAQYFEQAAAVGVEDSTLADQTNSFLWSLMRASQNTDAVTVILSVSSTAFGERAQEVQDLIHDLSDISERTEHSVTPTSDDEVAAVLRNRLFKSVDDSAAAEAAEAHQSFYRGFEGELPDRVTKADYKEQLERTYPFHPTLIDLLGKEIDTLPSFQRTRGALKLVSRAVYRIWNTPDSKQGRHYVRTFDMHPADDHIWSTLLDLFEHIEQDLRAASKSDIYTNDGKAACQYEDDNWTPMGHPPIATHLGVSVLWKSIVSGGNRVRGVTRSKLWEMILESGIELDHYRDALKSLNETGSNPDTEAFFLYETENGLLRFKGEPKISKLITNEANQIEDGVARNRLEQTIRGALGGGVFETIYDPQAPYEVPDDYETVRHSVMGFSPVTITSDLEDPPELLQTLVRKTGSSPGSEKKRVYRNNVVFLVAGEQETQSALSHARRVKAMERILNGEAWEAELNSAQRDDLDERLQKESALLGESVRQAYRHLYYPDTDGLSSETIDSVNDSSDLHDIVFENLESLDKLITQDEGALGTTWFRNRIWQSAPDSMTTLDIRELVAKRTDIRMVLNPKPLRATIRAVTMSDMCTFVFWDETTGGGYCPEGTTVTTSEGEKILSEAEQMSTDLSMSNVLISEDHIVYADTDSLLSEHDLDFPEEKGESGMSGNEGVGSGGKGGSSRSSAGSGGNGGVIEPKTPSVLPFKIETDSPSAIKGAFSEVNSAVDQKKMGLRDDYDVSSREIEVIVDSIEIELEGDKVWERSWFISDTLKDLDNIGGATSMLFDYTAQGTDDPDSVFEAGFEGSAPEFAEHFGTNRIPESFIGASGDSEGEAVLIIDTESMADNSREATLDVLQEALESLAGINNLELIVSGTVEESPEQSEEVSA